MRLSAHEIDAIKSAARDAFGDSVIVRLFGSRVDDAAKGGDIDLHFELSGARPSALEAGRFRGRLWQAIGERKIDFVFFPRTLPKRPIDLVAMEQGVVL